VNTKAKVVLAQILIFFFLLLLLYLVIIFTRWCFSPTSCSKSYCKISALHLSNYLHCPVPPSRCRQLSASCNSLILHDFLL